MESKSSDNEAAGRLCSLLGFIYKHSLLEHFYKAGEIVVHFTPAHQAVIISNCLSLRRKRIPYQLLHVPILLIFMY